MPLADRTGTAAVGSRQRRRLTRLLLLWSVLVIPGPQAQAQSLLTRDEQNVVHFGFASQLGSGVYIISGRTLQVYRLPFRYRLHTSESSLADVTLTLPVTIGFIGFKPQDVIDTGLPENLDSVSFVPGLAVGFRLSERWRLEPFAEAGLARDRTSEFNARVYSAGLRSGYEFAGGDLDWLLHNELVHAAVTLEEQDRTDDFTLLRTGLTARRPFRAAGEGRRADFLLYGVNEIYIESPDGPVNARDEGASSIQFEVGVTFGTTEPLRIWRIPLPRIGFGYRFGEDLSVYRLVLGAPF